ncbi:hypothetical protein LINPERHAP1_LOCUS30970 [Linum perenne]
MSWTGGDWMCPACQHQNFKKRESCQRCGYPKYGGPDVAEYLYNRTEVLAGDWYCPAINCASHNYASRVSCYRCGQLKIHYGSDSGMPLGWKSGDWVCSRLVTLLLSFTYLYHYKQSTMHHPLLIQQLYTGWDVEATILPAGENASNAGHQGNYD